MPTPKPTRVSLIQMSCDPDTQANLDKAVRRCREAAQTAQADKVSSHIICLPELFRAQYFCQREDHAIFGITESIPGPSTAALSSIVEEFPSTVLIASLFERRAPGLYHNTAAILDSRASAQDHVAGIYRKMHIPDDPLYYEKFYFTPGDLGFKALDTSAGRVGTLVCWDQWYPEAARETALRGATTLFYPTAIGWHPSEKAEFGEAQYNAWQTIQRAHAIANGVFVCAVNRVGHEHGDLRFRRDSDPTHITSHPTHAVGTFPNTTVPAPGDPTSAATLPHAPASNPGNRAGGEFGPQDDRAAQVDAAQDYIDLPGPGDHTPNSGLEFWGGSFIADPFGRILAQASHTDEETLTADLDPTLVETTRQHWPFLRDRRIDSYTGLTSRFLD